MTSGADGAYVETVIDGNGAALNPSLPEALDLDTVTAWGCATLLVLPTDYFTGCAGVR